ncbi:expressed unknown protein [Seminavis robusta]|uniref:Uncharacterized protein n=1 Tax=Seminavis robusta TaxID=568900 RepID=A0A9N8DJZ7_9STRA|nr:expressed unknown protein [Seminavis robusta]|eukprot:Sro183_g079730.1 n/a (233) ;mRNA; f:73915-74613
MCTTTQLQLQVQQSQTSQKLVGPIKRRPLFDLVLPTSTTTTGGDNQCQRQPAAKKRRITFTENLVTSYHAIPCLSELSEEELDQCYYKKRDLKIIKSQATKDMKAHERGTGTGGTTCSSEASFCARGLERRSRQGAKQFRQSKTKGWRAVFLEQARQRTSLHQVVNGKVYLAKVYQEVTKPSSWAAQGVAARDAQEAARIYLLSSASIKSLLPTNSTCTPPSPSSSKQCQQQ